MLPDMLKTFNKENPLEAVQKVTNLRTICQIMNSIESRKVMSKNFSASPSRFQSHHPQQSFFSTLRRLKTFLRSNMSRPHLHCILLLHVHKQRTDSIDLQKVAKEFVSVNEGKRNLAIMISSCLFSWWE